VQKRKKLPLERNKESFRIGNLKIENFDWVSGVLLKKNEQTI